MTKRSDDLNVVSNRLFEQVLRDAVTVWDRAAVFEDAGRCFHQLPPTRQRDQRQLRATRRCAEAIIQDAAPWLTHCRRRIGTLYTQRLQICRLAR